MSIQVEERPFEPPALTPTIQAANFWHLYWDVAWYGVVYGSTLSFLAVYATHLDATGWQIGLLSAGPALINIFFTLPAGRWVEQQTLDRAVVTTAFWQRLGFFLMIPLPLLLPDAYKVWVILSLTLLMAIPGTALAISFNALLATCVPPEHRGRVVGRRNALLAGAIMVTFVLSGRILDTLPFAWGYATVFIIGAVGGGLSTYHLTRIQAPPIPQFQMRPLQDTAQPGRVIGLSGDIPSRFYTAMRLWLRWRPGKEGVAQSIGPRYRWAMLAFFFFHFTQFLPQPLFPILWVRHVKLTDGEIGWINAFFYLTMLLMASFLEPLTKRLGNHRLTAIGSVLLSSYPLLNSLSYNFTLLLITNIAGALNWAILSGALVNRLLELTPADKRSAHLAVYNLVLNVATLCGTMLGPLLAEFTGLREALLIMFVLRVCSGLAMARWG
jgi:MFS family permease